MNSKTFMMLSASALSLILGAPAWAQDNAAIFDRVLEGDNLSPGQIKQLRKWYEICEEGGQLPGQRDCAPVMQAIEEAGILDSDTFGADADTPEPDSAEAPAPEAEDAQPEAAEGFGPEAEESAPEAAEAPAPAPEAEDAQPEAAEGFGPEAEESAPEAAEAPAPAPESEEAQPEAAEGFGPEAEAPAPEAAEVEKDAEGSPLPEAIDDAKDDAAEAAAPEAEDAEPDAAEAPAAEAEEAQPEAAEGFGPEAESEQDAAEAPEPKPATRPKARAEAEPDPFNQEPDPQAQADAVQRMDETPAAAATADPDAGERVEETITDNDVRRSDEDFVTDLSEGLQAGERARDEFGRDGAEDDRDRDGIDRAAGAALLGLGALALNEILGNGDRVVSNTGDRVVVEQGGQYRVLRNDDVLLRRPGAEVDTRRFDDGSTRNTVTYEDGTVVETIRAADGRVLRRTRTLPSGEAYVLFDDTQEYEDVEVNRLPQVGDQTRERVDYRQADDEALTRALQAQRAADIDRSFSLAQVRNIDMVRHLVPVITVDTINFETGSAAIRAQEAEELAALGNAMRDAIDRNPSEVFLIEGHTDAVGKFAYNLALSDRRAESVALALTEYFDVPPENMVLQGYGETDLLVETNEAERANRRAAVRRITPLLERR